MSSRRLQVFDRCQYGPRGVLVPGDRFRVRGGPVYVTDDGHKILMHERGVFVFRAYCMRGASKWIEASRADGGGIVVLQVSKTSRSRTVENLCCRPYRVTGKVAAQTATARRKPRKPRESGHSA